MMLFSIILADTRTWLTTASAGREKTTELTDVSTQNSIIFCSNAILIFGSKICSFLIGHHGGYQCLVRERARKQQKELLFRIIVFCSNGILTFGSKRRSFLSDIMMDTNATNDLSGIKRARKQQNELPIHIIVFCNNGILTFGSKRGSFLIGHHVAGYQCVAWLAAVAWYWGRELRRRQLPLPTSSPMNTTTKSIMFSNKPIPPRARAAAIPRPRLLLQHACFHPIAIATKPPPPPPPLVVYSGSGGYTQEI